MAKQGMKRPEREHRKNNLPPVPQIHGNTQEAPPYAGNDLAVENLREDFDLTAADLQDQ